MAPTGKARVVLSEKLKKNGIKNYKAQTLFQYLFETNHCDYKTWRYYLSGKENIKKYGTIIVDESSMINEDMFGAFVEASKSTNRIIFVGDPNQLPPIGAGKPFWALVDYIKKNKYLDNYDNLFISNRQKVGDSEIARLDVKLSKLFTNDQVEEVEDLNIFDEIANEDTNIKILTYNDKQELDSLLLHTIAEITKLKRIYPEKTKSMENIDDIDGFDYSLGGLLDGRWMNFNTVEFVDTWQILSPYRNNPEYGSLTINRDIHEKYRSFENLKNQHKYILTKYNRKSKSYEPVILGADDIILGDKVIHVKNQNREFWKYPWRGYLKNKDNSKKECIQYIANGEVGIVQRVTKEVVDRKTLYSHEVEFTSQPGYVYKYQSSVPDEDPAIELAYALTVHKAQGSGFKTSILVINEPKNEINNFISRELIYTALTRQSEKIYILYNRQPSELRKYANIELSDLARRRTNLFEDLKLTEYNSEHFDSNNIHITADGRYKVKSKSEVIIANLLHSAEIDYIYEKELKNLNGDSKGYRKPDFTIPTNGTEIYWEHCGMMGVSDYRQNWEEKKEVYHKNGISEEKGNLIVTVDDLSGGINSREIKEIIDEKLKNKNNENEKKEKDDFENMIYPLVVSYDLMDREDNIHKKTDNFLDLFEFITAFNVIISISAIPRELINETNIIKDDTDFKKVSFGNWLGLLRTLGKFYRSYKSQNKENPEIDFPFGIDFYKNISNKKIVKNLNEILELRNKKAHGTLREEIIIDKLDSFENDIYSIFEQFNNLQLIYIKKMNWGENNEFKYDVTLLNGRDSVFKTIELNTDYKLKLKHLYLYKHDTEEFLELKNELIKFIHCKKCSNWSIFVYNKITKDKAIYNSYQSEDHQYIENEITFENILY